MPGTKHITHTIHHRQMIYLYTIVCVYLTLPILICIGVIPWNMKFVALVFGVVAMYIVMRILGHTHSDIGIPRHPQPYTTRTTATPSAGAWRSSRPFGYVHIIYGDVLTVVIMSIVGLVWYRAYQRSSNLIGVTISHVVLGVMTIALGIID